MKSKTFAVMFAAAFALIAAPASAQQRRGAVNTNVTKRTNKPLPASAQKKSRGPARASALVQVVGGDRAAFDAKRAKLIDDSKAALADVSDAKTKSGAALTNRLTSLSSRLDVIETNSKALSTALNPRAVTGETKKARRHIGQVQSHHAAAVTHLAAAKKANRGGDGAAAQRAIVSLEAKVRAISSTAGKLAMLEPTMTR